MRIILSKVGVVLAVTVQALVYWITSKKLVLNVKSESLFSPQKNVINLFVHKYVGKLGKW